MVLDQNGKAVKKFKEKKWTFGVEPEFFDMFDFKWLAGSPTSSLCRTTIGRTYARRPPKDISETGKQPSANPLNS